MRRLLASAGRFAVTMIAVAAACIVGWQLWVYYMEAPWTRDGRVLADLMQAAPDVSGLVSEVLVHDNEHVQKGQVLFRIDPERYRLALQQAEAALAARQAAAQEAVREMNRYRSLSTLEVSTEQLQQRTAAAQQAGAAYQQAVADRDLAALNLRRTDVTSTVNGIITNFDMRPGNYVAAGHAVAAIVDTDSIYVDGYFEETKLARIAVGDPGAHPPDGPGRQHRRPCREHRRRHRRSRAQCEREPARQYQPDLQLGAPRAARAGAHRHRPRARGGVAHPGPHRYGGDPAESRRPRSNDQGAELIRHAGR